ncbi:hypothetical protein EN813_045025 [Mesorhizobium sp. M00.F.Ca.ET.170.01.1.1]|nr:hypothetical protein EN813_045025 [Mesorhizobium sp. M00.F.Ca.ET.170.01.1.1]
MAGNYIGLISPVKPSIGFNDFKQAAVPEAHTGNLDPGHTHAKPVLLIVALRVGAHTPVDWCAVPLLRNTTPVSRKTEEIVALGVAAFIAFWGLLH